MNNLQKTTAGLTLIAIVAFSGKALAQSNDNGNVLAYNNAANTEVVSEKEALTAPIVMEYSSSAEALVHSFDERIGIHIHHDSSDPISGFRYARGLANAATEAEKTGNRPMYLFASYEEGSAQKGSFVTVYMDGKKWNYEGIERFSPNDLWAILPVLMFEYEQKFGRENFIPEDVTPQLVASLD